VPAFLVSVQGDESQRRSIEVERGEEIKTFRSCKKFSLVFSAICDRQSKSIVTCHASSTPCPNSQSIAFAKKVHTVVVFKRGHTIRRLHGCWKEEQYQHDTLSTSRPQPIMESLLLQAFQRCLCARVASHPTSTFPLDALIRSGTVRPHLAWFAWDVDSYRIARISGESSIFRDPLRLLLAPGLSGELALSESEGPLLPVLSTAFVSVVVWVVLASRDLAVHC
jgi:hypothetical protein